MDIEGFIRMGFIEGDRQQMTVTPHTIAFIFVAMSWIYQSLQNILTSLGIL